MLITVGTLYVTSLQICSLFEDNVTELLLIVIRELIDDQNIIYPLSIKKIIDTLLNLYYQTKLLIRCLLINN